MDGTQLLDPAAGGSSRPASPGIDLSRPVSPDTMEPEPEPQTLAEIEAEGDEAVLLRTDSDDTDSNTDSSRASTVSSARSSYLARSQELAREYVDDETKNGCSTCPPTCAATMTFTAHVVRAALPPLYLLELVVRWVRVRCSHGATPTSPKQKLVTVRRCAECLGWMYYFLLIWEVLIHSADFHARLKRLAGTSGVAHNATAELFFGVDPFERNYPRNMKPGGKHENDPAYVAPPLSVTYFPVCAFMLLTLVHAHEETSYPRRMRIEYSVETDQILAFGVKLIKTMGHNPIMSEKQRARAKDRHSTYLVVGGTLTSVVFCLMMIWYWVDLNEKLLYCPDLESIEKQNNSCHPAVRIYGVVVTCVGLTAWCVTGYYTRSSTFEQRAQDLSTHRQLHTNADMSED
eukprot:COSAG06_NODE_10575_length_1656_cov_1.648041_1_plen_402_part_01